MALEQGIIPGTGLGWVRVSKDIENHLKRLPHVAKKTETVIVVTTMASLANKALLDRLENNPHNECSHTKTAAHDIMYIDEENVFPGETVRYRLTNRDDQFDFETWIRSMVEIPDTIDIKFESHRMSGRPSHVAARTMRKGRVVLVRHDIPLGRPVVPAMRELFANIERTCPKPQESEDAVTCGEHVLALLTCADAQGHQMIESWRQRDRDERRAAEEGPGSYRTYVGTSVTLPGAMLIDAGVDRLTLRTGIKSDAVMMEAELVGGHKVKDDETGTTVTLKQVIPETMLAAMRGRKVGDVVGAEWLKPLTIRTVPKKVGGVTTFRAFSTDSPFTMAEPVKVTREEIERRLRHAGIRHETNQWLEGGLWDEVDICLVPILNAMDDEALSVMFAKLELHNQVLLDELGQPGWIVRGQGAKLIAEKQPAVAIGTLRCMRALDGEHDATSDGWNYHIGDNAAQRGET